MKFTEKTLVVLCIIAVILKVCDIPSSIMLAAIGFCVLAIFYLFFSFALLNGIGFKGMFRKGSYTGISIGRIVAAIFVGHSFCILLLANLFWLANWNGAVPMGNAGFSIAVFTLLLVAIAFFRAKAFLKATFVRAVFFIIIPTITFIGFIAATALKGAIAVKLP